MTKNSIHIVSRAVIIDQEHILLCKNIDLPIDFYFLPGGHIEHGESAENSLLRELVEETGTKCIIKRLLGCIEYGFEPKHESLCHNHEYCFVFEIDQHSTLTVNQPIPKIEPHIEFFWVHIAKLDSIDLRPEPLKEFLPLWLASAKINTFQSMMV